MGQRRDRKDLTLHLQRVSRETNGHLKRAERERRETRLKTLLQKGKLPYTPTIMSWLSAEVNKPSKQITQADVDAYIKQVS